MISFTLMRIEQVVLNVSVLFFLRAHKQQQSKIPDELLLKK